MRKNSIRKFVHAVLDLIPLFIIPIFAIYTRNENYNSNIELQVQENREVAFNQLLNADYTNVKTNYYVNCNKTNATGQSQWWTLNNGLEYQINHKYYIRVRELENVYEGDYILLSNNQNVRADLWTYDTGIIKDISTINNNSIGLVFGTTHPINVPIKFYFNLIDLTQMFGEGNEPTQIQFDEWYTDNFYEYTTYKKEIIPNVLTTYNDTDVGSQFVYTLYNATDKYFNMNNVFNMNDVYDWFVLNIFGGNAPLGLYIVWNIVLYEFVMDLLMLLYGVFMFFIDCCTKLIEKPLNAIK